MHTPAGTLLRVGLTLFVGLALLAGCSDDDPKPGTVKPPTSAPASTSASPTTTTPEVQIEATMKAYFAAANDMFRTGEVTKVRSFSTSGCTCRKITRYVERIVSGGGPFRGTRYDDVRIRVHDIKGGTGLAEATVHVPPYKVMNGKGKVVEDSPGGTLHTDYSLVKAPEGETWIIGNAFDLG